MRILVLALIIATIPSSFGKSAQTSYEKNLAICTAAAKVNPHFGLNGKKAFSIVDISYEEKLLFCPLNIDLKSNMVHGFTVILKTRKKTQLLLQKGESYFDMRLFKKQDMNFIFNDFIWIDGKNIPVYSEQVSCVGSVCSVKESCISKSKFKQFPEAVKVASTFLSKSSAEISLIYDDSWTLLLKLASTAFSGNSNAIEAIEKLTVDPRRDGDFSMGIKFIYLKLKKMESLGCLPKSN